MSIRPAPAHWFETYIPRAETVYALEALAGAGSVHLELDPRLAAPLDVRRVREKLAEFDRLAQPYRDALPDCQLCPTALLGSPERVAAEAVFRLRQWVAQLEHLRERLALLEHERDQLELLAECIQALPGAAPELSGLAQAGRFLHKAVLACPQGVAVEPLPGRVVEEVVQGPEHRFLLVAALPEDAGAIDALIESGRCRALALPAWLAADPQVRRRELAVERARVDSALEEVRAEFEAAGADQHMIEALANVTLLRWYVDHAQVVGQGERLCHVTGWTTDPEPARLQAILNRAGIHGLVRFAEPPLGTAAPVRVRRPTWARPFAPFVDLWGVPGRAEVDPSGLLAVVVPLLFGYMFPDVGHGLILLLAGLLLGGRWPQLRLLVSCGIAAMGFGWVFGDVFGFHGLLAPLWVHPLEEPLPVLLLPLGFGAIVILVGMGFAGVEAHWRGERRTWLLSEAAVLLLYASLLAAIVWPSALLGVAIALLWYNAGALWLGPSGRRLAGLAVAWGRLLHGLFELVLATFSFVRVGAFAIAHAGLSTAIMAVAEQVTQPLLWLVVVVLGNLVALALEGLVVFVQTTRLVLFEFFLRFLRADGRVFQSLRRAGPVLDGETR